MSEAINGETVQARPDPEYIRVAQGTDSGFSQVLANLAARNPDHQEAVLAGAIRALVRYTIGHLFARPRLPSVVLILFMWTPIIRHAAETELGQR